jgi:hypothetical protein|tara:strand:+ start:1685 stop:2854 length:1170 start_codon:yes stop_codon:yes gene_type:complete
MAITSELLPLSQLPPNYGQSLIDLTKEGSSERKEVLDLLRRSREAEGGRISFGLGSFYVPDTYENRFLSAKDIPYDQPGIVSAFYNITPENVLERNLFKGLSESAIGNIYSDKNILGSNPQQAVALQEYIEDPGTVPSALDPKFAADAYDWVVREEARKQQTKYPSGIELAGGPLLTIGSSFLPGGKYLAPVVGGTTGYLTGGPEGGVTGFLGGLGAASAAHSVREAAPAIPGQDKTVWEGVKQVAKDITEGLTGGDPLGAIATGIGKIVVPSTAGPYGSSSLGTAANLAGSPGGQLLIGAAAPVPEYEGIILGEDAPPIIPSEGIASLATQVPGYVDPTPYLGRAPLSPAFMNQFERAALGSNPPGFGVGTLNPSYMNQFERNQLGST